MSGGGIDSSGDSSSLPLRFLLFALIFEVTRIQSVVPVLGVMRLQMLMAIALVFLWVFAGKRGHIGDQTVQLSLVFTVVCAATVLFAPNTFFVFSATQGMLLYIFAFMLPLLTFVKTLSNFRSVLRFWIWSHVFLAIWAFSHGGRGPAGYVGDQNDLALALNVTIPLAFSMALIRTSSTGARLLYLGATLLLALGVIVSQSRGGFLGLVAAAGVILWHSRHRLRNAVLAFIFILISGTAVISALPEGYVNEMASIADSQESTREQRVYFWKLGWIMFKDNPFFGVGANNYPWTVHEYEAMLPVEEQAGRGTGGKAVHSLYFQLIPELGLAGIVPYVLLIGLSFQRIRWGYVRRKRIGQHDDATEEKRLYCQGLRAALYSFLVTSSFISVLYYPVGWYLFSLVASLDIISRSTKAKLK